MELCDLYTQDRQRTGLLHPRGEKLPEGYYRLVVHVCIFNSRGELLIQERKATKPVWPGYFDISAGGSAIAGDTSAMAASRELYEELGLCRSFEESGALLTICFDNGFDDYYLLREDIDLATLRLQEEEVESARYATKEEVLALIDEGRFVPFQKKLIELLFAAAEVGHAHILD